MTFVFGFEISNIHDPWPISYLGYDDFKDVRRSRFFFCKCKISLLQIRETKKIFYVCFFSNFIKSHRLGVGPKQSSGYKICDIDHALVIYGSHAQLACLNIADYLITSFKLFSLNFVNVDYFRVLSFMFFTTKYETWTIILSPRLPCTYM